VSSYILCHGAYVLSLSLSLSCVCVCVCMGVSVCVYVCGECVCVWWDGV
jgi:hypothetical protein